MQPSGDKDDPSRSRRRLQRGPYGGLALAAGNPCGMPRVTASKGTRDEDAAYPLAGWLGYLVLLAARGTQHGRLRRLLLSTSVESRATSSLHMPCPRLISPMGADRAWKSVSQPASQSPHRRADGLAQAIISVLVSQEGAEPDRILAHSYVAPRSVPRNPCYIGGSLQPAERFSHIRSMSIPVFKLSELQDHHEAPLCGWPAITEFLEAPRRSSCTAQRGVSVQAGVSSTRAFVRARTGLCRRALSSGSNLVHCG